MAWFLSPAWTLPDIISGNLARLRLQIFTTLPKTLLANPLLLTNNLISYFVKISTILFQIIPLPPPPSLSSFPSLLKEDPSSGALEPYILLLLRGPSSSIMTSLSCVFSLSISTFPRGHMFTSSVISLLKTFSCLHYPLRYHLLTTPAQQTS